MSKFNTHLSEHQRPSLVEEIHSKLDEESEKDFYIALKNKRISPTTLMKVLSEFNIATSRSVLARWRSGQEPNGIQGKRKEKTL